METLRVGKFWDLKSRFVQEATDNVYRKVVKSWVGRILGDKGRIQRVNPWL